MPFPFDCPRRLSRLREGRVHCPPLHDPPLVLVARTDCMLHPKAMPISSTHWVAYPWKNEISLQMERVTLHLSEVLNEDYEGEHSPLDRLERALVIAAFSIRRMIEKRLVTDVLANRTFPVRSFPAEADDFRRPFHGQTGGETYSNYDFENAEILSLTIKRLADEVIHSSQLMVVGGDEPVPNGLLIASDYHLGRRVLHLTIEEFTKIAEAVLLDQVRMASDRWDPDTGHVSAERR